MKSIKFFLLVAVPFMLSSCTGTRWAEGLWILPWLTGLATLFFGYKAAASYLNGAQDGGRKVIPTGYLVFTAMCLIAFIVIITGVLE